MRLRPLFKFFAILVTLAFSSGCTSEAWITPLAPPRPAREADCPVKVTEGRAPDATENLGIVRCSEGEFAVFGDCPKQIRERACAIGGNVVYGAHWERSYRTRSLVGTVGFSGFE